MLIFVNHITIQVYCSTIFEPFKKYFTLEEGWGFTKNDEK